MASQVPHNAEYRQLRDSVYTFFYYSNKPIALTEAILQFKGVKKALLLMVLDDLVEKDKIFTREIGKSKVYCLSQNMTYEVNEELYTEEIDRLVVDSAANKTDESKAESDKTLRYLKWCYDTQMRELAELREEAKRLNGILSGYENQMSVEELRRVVKDMRRVVEASEEKGEVEKIRPEEFLRMKKRHGDLKKIAESRNVIFREIIDVICEGAGMKKSELYKAAGIEC